MTESVIGQASKGQALPLWQYTLPHAPIGN